jgi:hypothetical protein
MRTTAPPELLGVLFVMTRSFLYTAGLTEYVRLRGATSFTVMTTPTLVEPPALLAVTR